MKRTYQRKLIFIGLLSIFFFVIALTASAITDYKLEMPLLSGQDTAATPGQYIQMLYMYALGLAGIVGLFAMVWGGLVYMVSGSSETRKTEGKRWMWGAVSGIILLLFSYLIFFTLGGAQFISLKEPQLNENISNINGSGSYQLEMPLAGQQPSTPGEYIKTLFIFGLGGVGIVALFAILYGGTLYLLSGGFSATMKTRGKEWILAAIAGLALLLCSYLILATINPQLVNWSQKTPDQISVGGEQTNVGSTDNPYQLEMPLNGQQAQTPNQYIRSFFIFGLGLVGLVALFAIIYGGLNYILAGSSETRKTTGKQWISAAAIGVILLLCSFLILNTINPQLTDWNLEPLKKISINTETQTNISSQDNPYQLEMPLGASEQSPKAPSDYVRLLFFYGLGLVGAVGLFAIIWGGLNYVAAGSSETKKTEGKKWILGAISGIALLLCSYLILNTLNTQLISFQNPKLETIEIVPHTGYIFSSQQIPQVYSQIKGNWESAINKYASQYNVPPAMIYGVMMAESGGNPNVQGPQTQYGTAKGLMQLIDSTAAQMNVTNSYDPEQNIRGGTQYLGYLLGRYGGNSDMALAAYNWGPGNFEKKGGGDLANIPSETKAYINNVRKYGGF